jgi:hypothetical protein
MRTRLPRTKTCKNLVLLRAYVWLPTLRERDKHPKVRLRLRERTLALVQGPSSLFLLSHSIPMSTLLV